MMLFLYQLLYPFVALAVLARLVLAGRGGALREGFAELRERLGLLPESLVARLREPPGGPVLWIHAASAGEASAAAALVRRISERRPLARILMTSSTVAGKVRAAGLPGVRAAALAPIDSFFAVRAFLRRARPSCLILVETELWPLTLRLAAAWGARVGIANGRMREGSYRRYRLVRPLLAPALAGVERAALQTTQDLERFCGLGLRASAAVAAGNTKYDLPPPDAEARAEAELRLARLGWSSAPIWAAGSTRPGEEISILRAHRRAAERVPGLKLVLAPRHPERSGEVEALLRAEGVAFVRWSQLLPFQQAPDCLLVDRLGRLGSLYPLCRAAFVGGSLVPVGGHNLLEPAACGVPVLFGPHTETVAAEAAALAREGGGRLVRDAEELAGALALWLGSESERGAASRNALSVARAFMGASDRVFAHLEPILPPA